MNFLAKITGNRTNNIFTDKQSKTKVPLMFLNVRVLPAS